MWKTIFRFFVEEQAANSSGVSSHRRSNILTLFAVELFPCIRTFEENAFRRSLSRHCSSASYFIFLQHAHRDCERLHSDIRYFFFLFPNGCFVCCGIGGGWNAAAYRLPIISLFIIFHDSHRTSIKGGYDSVSVGRASVSVVRVPLYRHSCYNHHHHHFFAYFANTNNRIWMSKIVWKMN